MTSNFPMIPRRMPSSPPSIEADERNGYAAPGKFETASSPGGSPGRFSSGVEQLIACSLSENTRKSYCSDLRSFERWLGHPLPAVGHEIAEYLAAMASRLRPATLTRHLASIAKAHRAHGTASPTSEEIVRSVLKGLRRKYGAPQRQAKALSKIDLFDIVERLPKTLTGARDRALLLIGFAGAFRRSELVSIDVGHIERVRQGLVITLPSSKTDQERAGRRVGIPFGRQHCPVAALDLHLAASEISHGAVFRPINRHGQIDFNRRLSDGAVSEIVKKSVAFAGLEPAHYSGHSLRSGLATSAALARVPAWKIRAQTGHASDAMLSRYIRDGDMFTENAAGIL